MLLVLRVGSGVKADEHIRRIFRVRSYVLAMCVRMLLLVQLLAVLTLVAEYLTELRDYPREVAGWILAPVTATMALSTFLTTYFQRKSLRHFWLLVGVLGCAGSLWWLASVDNFTSKERIALMMGCWGLFVGLLPPSFLQDEIEGLDRRDALYAGALAVVCLIVPLIVIPTATSMAVSEWTDRAFDVERLNVRENSPEVQRALARTADYYSQRGSRGPRTGADVIDRLGRICENRGRVRRHPTRAATFESQHRRHRTGGDGATDLATQEDGLAETARQFIRGRFVSPRRGNQNE